MISADKFGASDIHVVSENCVQFDHDVVQMFSGGSWL